MGAKNDRYSSDGYTAGNLDRRLSGLLDLKGGKKMAVTPYEERKYVQSDAVTQAQQALQNQQANKPGEYLSQFQTGLNDLAGQIQNRDKFQYDVNSDALYQQVAQNYLQQGQQAMMDTMGQAAAMTGGYGNSYAQTAGQQMYNQHLQGLAELVPQYQQMALQQYQLEGEELLNQYKLMLQQEESAYGRYQDDLNRYYAELDRLQSAYDNERDYDYGRFADDRTFDYGKYQDELNYQYQVDRDTVADQQWLQQWEYQQERDKVADEQWQKEYDEMVRQYNENMAWQREQAALAAARAASSGGGGGSRRSGTPTTQNTGSQTFTEYMNEQSRNGLTTQGAAALITQAANEGIIKKEDQLNYMFIYG
jgi:hypothetical protein